MDENICCHRMCPELIHAVEWPEIPHNYVEELHSSTIPNESDSTWKCDFWNWWNWLGRITFCVRRVDKTANGSLFCDYRDTGVHSCDLVGNTLCSGSHRTKTCSRARPEVVVWSGAQRKQPNVSANTDWRRWCQSQDGAPIYVAHQMRKLSNV